MRVRRIHHIGIAVKDISRALSFYRDKLGLEFHGIRILDKESVKIAFLKIGDTYIELLEPISEKSTIKKFLEKRGEGVHHIALTIDNISDAIKELSSRGVKLVDHEPRRGAEGLIAFIHPSSTNRVLIELVEEE